MDFLGWPLFEEMISEAERTLADDLSNIDLVFRNLPLDVYGELLLEIPERYPRLRALLPSMASEEVQRHWAGSSGTDLLHMGTNFVKSALKYFPYDEVRERDLRALDFGCGWGRLLRLFSKYFPINSLEGVDPMQRSLDACLACNVRHPLTLSDYLPTTLSTKSPKFHFIYSFSVFSHLAPIAIEKTLGALRQSITDDGTLLLTIRPVAHWERSGMPECVETHNREGFCFVPFEQLKVDGEFVYGDTSMKLAYFDKFPEWRISNVEFTYDYPYQIYVALKPN